MHQLMYPFDQDPLGENKQKLNTFLSIEIIPLQCTATAPLACSTIVKNFNVNVSLGVLPSEKNKS